MRAFSGIFFFVHFLRRTSRKIGSKCPMCPQGKNDSGKILTVERTARPKYRQDTRRGCTICCTAAVLAVVFAVPAGIYLAGRTGIALAFILAMIVFMSLFVFLPKLIQRGMQADAQAMVEAFGKNEQVMKVIWTLVVAMTALVITKVLDPGMAQEVVGVLTTGGCEG